MFSSFPFLHLSLFLCPSFLRLIFFWLLSLFLSSLRFLSSLSDIDLIYTTTIDNRLLLLLQLHPFFTITSPHIFIPIALPIDSTHLWNIVPRVFPCPRSEFYPPFESLGEINRKSLGFFFLFQPCNTLRPISNRLSRDTLDPCPQDPCQQRGEDPLSRTTILYLVGVGPPTDFIRLRTWESAAASPSESAGDSNNPSIPVRSGLRYLTTQIQRVLHRSGKIKSKKKKKKIK